MGGKIKRALLSVSDKTGIVELARALVASGTEIIATGNTARVLIQAGLVITPIEKVSGSPEAFQGRMKTLSFPVCSGILYRRGDPSDEADLARLGFSSLDCVVVNFYPFEKAASQAGITRDALIDEIDIGGPTLVRAGAKNAPSVLVLTHPSQYPAVIQELASGGAVSTSRALISAAEAWDRVLAYDQAIASRLGGSSRVKLRYGENPHQEGFLEISPDSPIDWPRSEDQALTSTPLSYNNILDLSAGYSLASDCLELSPDQKGVVIIKHNNPCGVAVAPTQKQALVRAWEGDPVSAFGGVLIFTHPIEEETARWLSEKFIELVAAPGLTKSSPALRALLVKRKNLRAVPIRRFGEGPSQHCLNVPGGRLIQTPDLGMREELRSVTRVQMDAKNKAISRFGIAVCRALKSNAIALVRALPEGGYQLVGAGQGQPNRIEALNSLAIPRAEKVLEASGDGVLADCVMVSDAFFPFRDTVDAAFKAGLRVIVQPGGSIKDAESILACDETGVAMAFTGTRHFRH